MGNPIERHKRFHSSRQRYRGFVQDYPLRRLDDAMAESEPTASVSKNYRRGKRREYLREYVRWLWPHRAAVIWLLVLALVVAGLPMVEPLFMRFIIDRVLLKSDLDPVSRLSRLNLAGIL